ncbi:hypothetical protein NGH88_05615 [Enterococcus faecalis]|uniref:hypothetical protein n=1 Tax=Enterococcus faecalis TaxID=1351 RepID=UPI002DB690AA|nr:hypothetical protein [Enterococcus faecalis]MEB7920555.1 hypothetical protein [Enterococcus faecalis]
MKKDIRFLIQPTFSMAHFLHFIVALYKNQKWASNTFIATKVLYQVSLFTDGTEKDLKPLKNSFKLNGVHFNGFSSIQGDENDDTITNFYTEVSVYGE